MEKRENESLDNHEVEIGSLTDLLDIHNADPLALSHNERMTQLATLKKGDLEKMSPDMRVTTFTNTCLQSARVDIDLDKLREAANDNAALDPGLEKELMQHSLAIENHRALATKYVADLRNERGLLGIIDLYDETEQFEKTHVLLAVSELRRAHDAHFKTDLLNTERILRAMLLLPMEEAPSEKPIR